MWYYVADYTQTGHGFEPLALKGAGYLLLASPGGEASWGLFECSRDVPADAGARSVDPALRTLLESAKSYSPALAIARDDLTECFPAPDIDEATFLVSYAKALRKHMRAQSSAGYRLREAVGNEPGYLQPGAFYWVLDPESNGGLVRWVAGDYFVYRNPSSDFSW